MMLLLGFSIGIVVGIFGTFVYFSKNEQIPLHHNAILIYANKTSQSPWRVSLDEKIAHKNIQAKKNPCSIFELQQSECSFDFSNDLSILCQDSKRIDVQCRIQISAKRDVSVLEKLLAMTDRENLNQPQWIQKQIEDEVLQSIGIFRINTQEYWLHHLTLAQEHWNARLEALLGDWTIQLHILNIQPTADAFYNINNPEEHKHLLQLQHSQIEVDSIKQKLKEYEQTLKKITEQELLLQQRNAQWQDYKDDVHSFQQQTKLEIQQMARDVQQDLATLKMAIREEFFQLAEQYPKELLEQHFQSQSAHRINTKRNASESLVENQQVTTLQQLATLLQKSPDQDSPSS